MDKFSFAQAALAPAEPVSSQPLSYGSKDLQVVLSYGQSLSVGSVTTTNPISTRAVYSGKVVQAVQPSSGASYFKDLLSPYNSEPPLIAALNRMAANFERDGLLAPTLAGAISGVPGQSLAELYLGSSDKYADTTAALAATSSGDLFYTHNAISGKFDVYLNESGSATIVRSYATEPRHFDKVIASLQAIKAAADNGGYDVTDKILFSFIQGQGDTRPYATKTYSSLLNDLVNKIDKAADEIFGKDLDAITVIGQSRNAYVSKEQLHFVASTKNSYLGALESPLQAENSSAYNYVTGETYGAVNSHLNSLGYNLLGQETGDVLYQALRGTESEDNFLRVGSAAVEGVHIVVSFSGLKGVLFEDNSIFGAAVGGFPPENLGFRLSGNSKYWIVDAAITGPNEVTLTANRSIDRTFSLILGDSKLLSDGSSNSFGGTPLRDSETKPADDFFGISQLATGVIRKFIPDQSVTLDKFGIISGTLETTGSVLKRLLVGGTSGDDFLVGTEASDLLQGKSGDDKLDGGAGYDVLTGGSGADCFHFSYGDVGRADTITDFAPSDGDFIDVAEFFSGKIVGPSTVDQQLKLEFVDHNTMRLLVDPSGTGEDFQVLAVIDHGFEPLDLTTLLSNGGILL